MSELSELDKELIDAILQHLQSEHVVAEYNRRSQVQKPQFMMAYAGYLMWLAKVGRENREPQKVRF